MQLLSSLLAIYVLVHFTCQSKGQSDQRKKAILAKGMKLPEHAMTFSGDSLGEINMPKLRQAHPEYNFASSPNGTEEINLIIETSAPTGLLWAYNSSAAEGNYFAAFYLINGSLEFVWTYPNKAGGISSEFFNFKPVDKRLPNGFASNVPIHINITRFYDNVCEHCKM
jgi:hypothetical protein